MKVKEYWEQPDVVSMSDRRLSELESNAIAKFVKETDSLLNVGCGDGEGCFAYREKCNQYTGFERSSEMINRFKEKSPHTKIIQGDIVLDNLPGTFDTVVTQRSLINLETEENQKVALRSIVNATKPNGRVILCEAFEEGLEKLNEYRNIVGLEPMKPRWHAKYLTNDLVADTLKDCRLEDVKDFSTYFFLTRVLHAAITENPSTETKLNDAAQLLQQSESVPLKGIGFIKVQIWTKI